MNDIFIRGTGAVSPAGWGATPLLEALRAGEPLPVAAMPSPVAGRSYPVRTVPAPAKRPAWMTHPRLRRASAISQFIVAAAVEALQSCGSSQPETSRIGIVTGTHAAGLRYSERFFGEVLRDPLTASPLLFPETVVNAPASHLAAFLGGSDLTYSLLGDQTAFVQALAIGAEWLLAGRVDWCLVAAAEEAAWTTAEAIGQFGRGLVCSEGAGALVLSRTAGCQRGIALERITNAHLFAGPLARKSAAKAMREEMPSEGPNELLVDARCGMCRLDQAEGAAWQDWAGPRLSPRVVLGEGLSAATAWQCVAACAALAEGQAEAANVSVVGGNEQAIGVRFGSAAPRFPIR